MNAKILENVKIVNFEFWPPCWTSDAILNLTNKLPSIFSIHLEKENFATNYIKNHKKIGWNRRNYEYELGKSS
jgi:hypothetical protein